MNFPEAMPTIPEPESEPTIESLSEKVKEFAEAHREKFESLRQTFLGEDYQALLQSPQAISDIFEDYCERYGAPDPHEQEGVKFLLSRLLLEIVGADYLEQREESLRQVDEKEGLYLPANKIGGGDYWLKQEAGGQVGEIELCDVVGHGLSALGPKIWLLRLLELRQKEISAEESNLFQEVDQFLSRMPGEAEITSLLSARLDQVEGRRALRVEMAGNIELFTRQETEPGTWSVVRHKLNSYLPVGMGDLGVEIERKGGGDTIDLPESATAFITSDGLFDIRTGEKFINDNSKEANEIFGQIFEKFCAERQNLSPADFQRELYDYIHRAEAEGRTTDDITLMVL